MAEIAYRRPAPDDIDALCELGRATFVETFGDLYSKADLDAFLAKAFGPDGIPAEYANPAYDFRVAEVDGSLVGYCKVGPPYLPAPDDGRSKGELRQLYILKNWHGAGIAQAMMDWALAWARAGGFDDLYLSVFSENVRAQRLYARYGFEKVGEFKFMVGEQADHEFLYRLKLKP